MLVDVTDKSLKRVAPLFDGLPGLHGCIDAALEGTMGRVLADSADRPTLAILELDFWFLAGDSLAPGVRDFVRSVELPASFVTSGPAWARVLRDVWGEALQDRTRVAFECASWDRERVN